MYQTLVHLHQKMNAVLQRAISPRGGFGRAERKEDIKEPKRGRKGAINEPLEGSIGS